MSKKIDRRNLLISGICALASPTVRAQSQEFQASDRTEGSLNGRFWTIISKDARLDLVLGIHDGFVFCLNSADEAGETTSRTAKLLKTMRTKWDTHYSYGEIVSEIDKLYEEPANHLLPVSGMYLFACRIFNGEDPKVVQTNIVNLRRIYLQSENKP